MGYDAPDLAVAFAHRQSWILFVFGSQMPLTADLLEPLDGEVALQNGNDDVVRLRSNASVNDQQSINTATPAGRMTFSIFGALGEYERSLIIERIHAGIARAKAEGVRFGRPRVYGDEVRAQVIQLRAKGIRMRDIARQLRVGFGTVWRVCRG